MMEKIKATSVPTWIIIIVITSIISLTAFIFKGICDDVKEIQKSKADNAAGPTGIIGIMIGALPDEPKEWLICFSTINTLGMEV